MYEVTAQFLTDVRAILDEADLPPEEEREILKIAVIHTYKTGQIDEIERDAFLS